MATPATFAEFTAYHGMLSPPAASRRCTAAFDGTVVFMPSNYRERGIAHYDWTGYYTLTYYALVLASLTGLSTLLGCTNTVAATESLDSTVPSKEILSDILEYLAAKQGCQPSDLCMIRRFHFRFRLPGINVKMFHVRDKSHGPLHLVEIYEKDTLLPYIYAALAVAAVGWFRGLNA
ncbi:hypothetical protein HDV03_001257 [Kappamyces sp. JEL0829]|nr:hypothetical protein HDV03_001257 [Kappamyces sp. JEL0829]